MKRRNFMLASSGLAGSFFASVSRAAVPCPPPTVVAGGVTAVSPSCPVFGAGGGNWAAQNPNYPTDAYTDYSELIFSANPIAFPGGYMPAGA